MYSPSLPPSLPPSIHPSFLQEVIPAKYLDEKTVYHIQPSGSFIIGGPQVNHTPR